MVGTYGNLYLFRQGDVGRHVDGGNGITFQCVFQGGGIAYAYAYRRRISRLSRLYPCPYGWVSIMMLRSASPGGDLLRLSYK